MMIIEDATGYVENMINLPDDVERAVLLDWQVFVGTLANENYVLSFPEMWDKFNTNVLQRVYGKDIPSVPEPSIV